MSRPLLCWAAMLVACADPPTAPPRTPPPRPISAPPAATPEAAPLPPPAPIAAAAPASKAEDPPPQWPTVEEGAPPAKPIRWVQGRDCPLGYDYRVTHRTEAPGSGSVNGFDILAQLDGVADPVAPSRVRMRFLWTRRDTTGPRGTFKGVRAEEDQPELVLFTDGTRWFEAPQVGGASRGPDIDRVAQLLPTLPAAVAPGAQAAWKPPPMSSPGVISVFEPLRSGPIAIIDRAPLELRRWIKVGGELACELESGWSREKSTDERSGGPRILRRAAIRGAARFVVLASGRLLSAEVHESNDTFTAVQDPQSFVGGATPTETHETVSSELRLVRACSGVTLPPLHPPPLPTERALQIYVRLRKAATSADRSTLGSLLGPSLAKNKDAAVAALIDYMKRFGASSLGFTGTPRATPTTDGDKISFTVSGIASESQNGAARSSRAVVVIVVEQRGDDLSIRSIKVGTSPNLTDLLEISEARVFAADAGTLVTSSAKKR